MSQKLLPPMNRWPRSSEPLQTSDPEGLRRGNIRRAMRIVAKERGINVRKIKYNKRLPYPGAHWGEPWHRIAMNPRASNILVTAAHELAHAAGEIEHGTYHQDRTREIYRDLRAKALELAARDKGRKSASGSEVEVSAYTRNGNVEVDGYTRRKPGK